MLGSDGEALRLNRLIMLQCCASPCVVNNGSALLRACESDKLCAEYDHDAVVPCSVLGKGAETIRAMLPNVPL